MTEKKKPIDWEPIERDYRAGIEPIYQIGIKHGVHEASIRTHARRCGWTRLDSKTEKRKRVEAALATGIDPSSTDEDPVQNVINQGVEQDIKDMRLGVDLSRKILNKVSQQIDVASAPRDLKILSETVAININTIRRIRGLDDKDETKDDLTNWSEDELKAELARLTNG